VAEIMDRLRNGRILFAAAWLVNRAK